MEYDPRKPADRYEDPLTSTEIDVLADITNGNCGIVALMRQTSPYSDITSVASFEEVETTVLDLPPVINDIIKNTSTNGNYESFLQKLYISDAQQHAVEEITRSQSENKSWFSYRNNRITASKFRDAVHKVNDDGVIINPTKCRTIVSKVCSYSKRYETKATKWGIENEPVARNLYIRLNKSKHRKFVVTEPGFFIDIQHPFIGASPDGLVKCDCHGEGVLEIKCPWVLRYCNILDYANDKSSCLEHVDGKVKLKRNHSYFYQVQCQMKCTNRTWCHFFVCTSKDTFLESITYGEDFMNNCISKAAICFEKVIFPELCSKTIYNDIEVERNVKEVVSYLLEIIDDNVDFQIN